MERIPSFGIDHTKLQRGVYVSRYDRVLWKTITTFDIRMKTPYKERPLSAKAIHTLEHLAATWLRNERNDIIYFGPMGCQTGFYLIMKGKFVPTDIQQMLVGMFHWMASYEGVIPGSTEQECGNCYLNDLQGAKKEAKTFLKEVLCSLSAANTTYPE